MDRDLALKSGFSLWELSVVVLAMGILLTAAVSAAMNFVNRAKFQATVREMDSIARSAIDYYNSSAVTAADRSWPASLASLAPVYMPRALVSSPLGSSYQMSFGVNAVTVSTMLPKGTRIDAGEGSFLSVVPGPNGDQISITRSIPNEFSGRLGYDLRYMYKQ